MSEWREVFWITFSVIILTNVAYVIMGSGDVQPWNDITVPTEEEAIKWGTNSGN